MIALDGVTVRYGPATALAGVTEQVRGGEWLGLIGPVLRHWRTPTVGASFILSTR